MAMGNVLVATLGFFAGIRASMSTNKPCVPILYIIQKI